MKRGELINKGAAGAITLLFLAAVRPDPTPNALEWGVVALLMYEGLTWCVRYARLVHARSKRQKARDEYERWLHYDGKNWAKTWLYWPIHEEVS